MSRVWAVRISLVVLICLVVAACRGAGVSPEASQSADAATSATASPTAVAHDAFDLNTIVVARVGVQVRQEPGTAGAVLGSLPDGALSMVVEGPVSADGLPWYRVHALGLPRDTGCTGPPETDPFNCPGWFGWAAAADADGEAALVEDVSSCPRWDGRVTDELLFGHGFLAYLACFGGETRSLTGYYPVIPDDAGLGGVCESPDDIAWLACNPGYEKLTRDAEQDFFSPGLEVVVAPGVEMPERGQLIEVTGHYDDPAASACAFGDDPDRKVLACRAQFVVTDARAIDS